MSRPPTYHSASTTSKSSSVYQSVPTLPGGPFCSPNNAQAAPVDESQLPDRRKAKTLQVLGITLILLTSLLLPLATWCCLAVLTTTNATRFLLLSTISTTVTKAIVGPLMALHAYTASVDWLRSSGRDDTRRLPSPTHFGSLLSLYQGTSFIGLISTCRGGLKRGHLAWPPILKRVVAVLSWLLFLAYSLTLVSLWLQIDAEPVRSVPTTSDFPSLGYDSKNTMFTRRINQTLCTVEDARQLKSTFRTPACGLIEYLWDPWVARVTASLAQEVYTNDSDISRAAWLEDNTAILVPAVAPRIGYQAKAVGVRATCQSVTHLCVRCNSTQSDVPLNCTGTGYTPSINCTAAAGIKLESSTADYNHGPISPTNGSAIDRWFNANPFTYGKIVTSAGYINASLVEDGVDHFAGTTGFIVRDTHGAVNVLKCNVSVYDVAYQFTPPETYAKISSVLSNITTAEYVAYGMTAWFAGVSNPTRGFELIDGTGQRGNATYPQIYARQLSKIGISGISRIIPATSSDLLLAGSGTRVTLVGMMLLFILNACIIITTTAIGAHAAIVILRCDSKFVSAARGRLLSAYPLLGDVFGGLKYDFVHHKAAVSAGMHGGALLQESEADRLLMEPEFIDGGPTQGQTLRLRPGRV